MSTVPTKQLLTTFVFALVIFLIPLAFASAQTCTADNASTVCTGGKICKEGSCQTPEAAPTATGGGSAGTTGNCGTTSGTLVNPLKVCSLEALLDLVLVAVIRIGTIVLIMMLVWVGFLFVTARGNEEKLRDARRAFFWTIIGGLILLGARGLSAVIQSTANTLGP
ncbi:MAG: hypothetical protein QOE22_238 [Candidatus Parcubacteria bacterium]|nr:hypothetical protein [Candidatus Parcubacteria bacterium]